MQDGTTIQLTARRSITFTTIPDQYGRCVYQVQGIGAFTIEPDAHGRLYDERDYVHVTFGRVEGEHRWIRTDQLPDRPVVCRVELEGASTFNPAATNPASPYGWLSVRRSGGGSAPTGTSRRAGEIVHALVRHWLARDDHDELVGYHRWHLAPERMRGHGVRIDRLNQQLSQVLTVLAKEHAGYAEQAAIRDRQPLDRGWTPDPSTREGQTILRLYEQLAMVKSEHRGLPGAEVVPLLEKWLTTMNLTLPDR
ncbi:hypothetical protein ABZ671_18720 [Micromonospora sp. NPDC006766]|uniref:hypothetical protein n=1 Tax=Micromonospora sp. NPDC006766 TaxID=3154778 RepID=UPI0034101C30